MFLLSNVDWGLMHPGAFSIPWQIEKVNLILFVFLRLYYFTLFATNLTFLYVSGEKHGYNIPEVKAVPHVAHWLSEDGVKLLSKCPDDKMLPDYAKRLICDGYMCFYQSPQVMMYQ